MVTLALRAFGFPTVQRLLGKLVRRRPKAPSATDFARAEEIAKIVATANRKWWPLVARCLPRAMALACLLGRRGIDNELRIGVRTLTGAFEAHAWVEVDGQALGEPERVQEIYTAFDLPSHLTKPAALNELERFLPRP